MTNEFGTLNLTWNAGIGAWEGCQQITHPISASTIIGAGNCIPGGGTTHLVWRVDCINRTMGCFFAQVNCSGTYYVDRDVACNTTAGYLWLDLVPAASGSRTIFRNSYQNVHMRNGESTNASYFLPAGNVITSQAVIVTNPGLIGGSVAVPNVLHLSDGIDSAIPMVYRPQTNGSISGTEPNLAWWGCAYRSTAWGRDTFINSGPQEGAGGCVGGDKTVTTPIVYKLFCYPTAPNQGYFLRIIYRGCGFNGPSGGEYRFIKGTACDADWTAPGGALSGYGSPLTIFLQGGSAVQADDCDPFSISFPVNWTGATDLDQILLTRMFGPTNTWTISA